MLLKDRYSLKNDVHIPKVMMGSFKVQSQDIMTGMVETAINTGCYGFDTSPSYGTEAMLGNAIEEIQGKNVVSRKDLFIADKVDGWQMCKSNGNIKGYVEDSLRKMKLDYFDLLLIHWPFEKYLKSTWAGMEGLLKEGVVRSIGLSNVNIRIYEKFLDNKPEIEPQVIQNEISPLNVCTDDVAYFQNRGIQIQAYSPLCRMAEEIKESAILRDIADEYKKTIQQIILRWNLERNIIPIFTSSKPERIVDNLSIFDFSLNQEDIEKICDMNQNYKIFPESYGCPGY